MIEIIILDYKAHWPRGRILQDLFAQHEIIDISPVISSEIAVFPGDVAYSRTESLSFSDGHNLGLSAINSTVHLGAHTDAPNHYHPQGVGIEKRNLELYMGLCQVIEVDLEKSQRIRAQDLKNDIHAPRVLFKTSSFPDPNNWNDDFNSCSSELIKELARKNVQLVGIDTPSVDLANDKELESHNEIYRNDMAILEGIVLKNVEPGLYQLVCLPLPLKGSDASPVRAILLKEKA